MMTSHDLHIAKNANISFQNWTFYHNKLDGNNCYSQHVFINLLVTATIPKYFKY